MSGTVSDPTPSPAEELTGAVYRVTVDFEVVANSPADAHQYLSEQLGFSDPRVSVLDIIPDQEPQDEGDEYPGEPIGGYLEQMEP